MDFQVLGPLRAVVDGVDVEVRGAKERTLLMHLVASAGHAVPIPDLVDSLWPHDPPRTAAKSLQTYVLRLRNSLEPDRAGEPRLLVTEGAGYRLAITDRQTDAGRFARLTGLARAALEGQRWQAALDAAQDALALWRGPAYPGCEDTSFGPAEARRLDELRVQAQECRLEAMLALGHEAAVVAEAERVVTDHPLRERLWELLMLASYRAGRQGAALDAYDRARAVLADELGVDPGPGLRDLHARVLAQDPSLDRARPGGRVPDALRHVPRELVGRDGELAALRDQWHRTVAGATCVAVVRGPAGAGVTALAAVLAHEVAPTHPVLLGTDPAPATGPWLRVVDGGPVPAAEAGAMLLVLARPGDPAPDGATVLDLRPLVPDEVRRVVAAYASPDEVADLAAEVTASGVAWPGHVHLEAARLARESASQRLGAAVGVAARSSAQLAAARADVSDSIVRLTADDDRVVEPGVCPWRGLASYDVADAPWFAGREHLVAELLSRVASARLLAVVGTSGSGKSSTLRAGVLAALAADALPGSSSWHQVVMRPGRHPMRELARAALGRQPEEVGDLLARLLHPDGAPARTLVVVDQMEEVWTACGDEGERAAFLDTLVELATEPGSAITVLLALRADYVGEAADHPQLAALLADGTVLVGSPTAAEVRRAITRPAARAGLEVEEGLADTIVSDAGDEPGLLPLLSVALTQVWAQRDGDRLTFAGYVAGGGLRGAIASLAEQVWEELDEDGRQGAQQLLLRLAGPGEGVGVVRRRVPLAEIEALGRPGLRRVLERLADARLVTVGDGHVEVAHEALFREWPRLRSWLTDDAAGRVVQRRLALAAAEWDAEGREPTALWRGARLQSGLEIADAHPDELTHVERDFLEHGRRALEAEQEADRTRAAATARQNRRLKWLLIGTAVFLVLALVAGLVALVARDQAEESAAAARSSATSAEAKRLAASALNVEYPDLALLTAVEATRLEAGPETYGAVLTLLARQPDVVTRFHTDDRFLRGDATPDGETVYVTENDPTIHALDAVTGEEQWEAELPDMAGEVAVSPDGRHLAVSVLAAEGGITVGLDPATGEERWRFGIEAARELVPDPGPFFFYEVRWLPDGRLVVPTETHLFLAEADTGRLSVARRWDRPVVDFQALVVWPDGRVSTTAGESGPTVVVDVVRPRTPPVEVPGVVLAVSPDGRRVLQLRGGDDRGTLRLLDARTLRPVSQAWPVDGFVQEAVFSPDGGSVAVAVDEQVLLRDGDDLRPLRTLEGHSGAVMSVVFAGPDHDLVWTAGRDGRATAFDASGRRGVVAEEPTSDAPHAGSAVPDGPAVWTNADPAKPNRAWLRMPGEVRGRPLPPDGRECSCQVAATALSDDGSTVVGGYQFFGPDGMDDDRGQVRVWDTATRETRHVVRLPWPVSGVDVLSDGSTAVVQGTGGWLRVDLESGEPVGEPATLPETSPNYDGLGFVQVAPDDDRALLVRDDGVRVVDLASGRTVAGPGPRDIASGAWTRDGRAIALGGYDGWFSVLDAATLDPVAPRRLITGGFVLDVEVSPDGRTAATVGSDGDLTLWDVATWQPYGQPVVDLDDWGFLSFSADSATVSADYETGTRVTVAARPEAWVAAACAAANRDLTAEESAVVRPEEALRPTCD